MRGARCEACTNQGTQSMELAVEVQSSLPSRRGRLPSPFPHSPERARLTAE